MIQFHYCNHVVIYQANCNVVHDMSPQRAQESAHTLQVQTGIVSPINSQ